MCQHSGCRLFSYSILQICLLTFCARCIAASESRVLVASAVRVSPHGAPGEAWSDEDTAGSDEQLWELQNAGLYPPMM